MAIPEAYQNNFQSLHDAFLNGDACAVECKDKITGKQCIVICAHFVDDDELHNIVPYARFFDGSPYDEITPPLPEDFPVVLKGESDVTQN